MKLYKLTDESGQTYGGTQWGPGVTHSGTGEGELCGPGLIHLYTDPLLAALLNPIHANFAHPRLWEAEGDVARTDRGLKVGCVSAATVREVPLPEVTTEQRVGFAILVTRAVCEEPSYVRWATAWLDNSDRTEEAAWAAWAAAEAARAEARAEARAARAARAAAEAAAWAARAAAEAAAAAAARAATDAARAATDAAWAAEVWAATDAAWAAEVWAVWAATDAARAAAEAAAAAALAADIDFIALAHKAVEG